MDRLVWDVDQEAAGGVGGGTKHRGTLLATPLCNVPKTALQNKVFKI